MYINILLLFSFYAASLTAQVKTIYFDKDVATIEYLTLSFCVDSIGKTSRVSMIEDKTNYKNKETIARIIDYRKGIHYYPETSLKNDCHKQVFQFVNTKYENKILSKEACNSSEKFRKGKFRYKNPVVSDFEIVRRKNKQIEQNADSKYIYDTTWITNCEYRLKHVKSSNGKYEDIEELSINVKIIDILENGNYIYKSNMPDQSFVIGEIIKL